MTHVRRYLMKLLWADLQFLNIERKLSVLPVYCFEHALHEKRYTTLLERQFKLSGLIQYSLCVLKDLNVSVVTTCLHITHVVPPHDLQHLFFFTTGTTFALTRISFRHFCSSKPNYRNLKDSIIGTTEGFFGVGIENCPVWDLNPQLLNSVQTL